jgi:hypothetical protein
MDIERLARSAVDIIKSKWGLPQSGLLAGGSLGNIIWELTSGNPAVVNDIDIFYFDGKIESLDNRGLFQYKEEEVKYLEDYIGMTTIVNTRDFYTITEANKDGIFNNILYQSNVDDPLFVINSFDINSTKVCYLIEQDKFYWTEDFEDFLKTGQLKTVNLRTPSHTAIRLVKKSHELNCQVDEFEFKLLQHAIKYGFSDIIKIRFQERYKELFDNYSDFLGKYFLIEKDTETEIYLKNSLDKDVNLWMLKSNDGDLRNKIDISLDVLRTDIFKDLNLDVIYRSDEFLFYMRNIFNNPKLVNIWKKLRYFFKQKDYFDKSVDIEDIELLSRLSIYAPKSINNLNGYKLSDQIHIVKSLLDRFKDDPIIAISILEKSKISRELELDEKTLLLLELSVRKEIVNDTRGKVSKILLDVGEKDELSDIF